MCKIKWPYPAVLQITFVIEEVCRKAVQTAVGTKSKLDRWISDVNVTGKQHYDEIK